MEGNIFELASRGKTRKIRFAYKGSLSVEDLWDLSVQELDRIFKGLNAKLKVCKEESLLGPKESENTELSLQVAIVRRIVEVKLAEAAAHEMEAEKKAKRQKILSILAEKQDQGLMGQSEEDLKKMLEGL
ncbi:hypothetical protein M0R72_20075 [Candidatus Pacearchaeota archaeon]|jgi:hypothetical protein|nr:hypothetical protein [Candidatus Pacearchaeota archaeon]